MYLTILIVFILTILFYLYIIKDNLFGPLKYRLITNEKNKVIF